MECVTKSFAVSLLLLLTASHVIAQTGQSEALSRTKEAERCFQYALAIDSGLAARLVRLAGRAGRSAHDTARLVCRRPFGLVNDDQFDWTFRGFKAQPQLLP